MPYQLSDIYIGEFPITQAFGARPDIYGARYGMKGHNGIDIGCPTMTPVLSAADGTVAEVSFDAGGFGRYIVVNHDGYATLYAHLNDVVVNVKDRVVAGQLIAHSNNSGFSDGPHLHFGVKPIDANGNKTEPDNGYDGYIDPLDKTLCVWNIKNLKEPVVPNNNEQPPVPVQAADFTRMVAQGANYVTIANYLVSHGINDYLANNQLGVLDLQNNAGDPTGGNKIVAFIAELLNEKQSLQQQLNEAKSQTLQSPPSAPAPVKTDFSQTVVNNLPEDKKNGFLSGVMSLLANLGVLQQSS